MNHPATRRRPTPQIYGNVSYDDDYQWLEIETPETLEWQARQHELTERYMADWPGKRWLEAAIARLEGNARGLISPDRQGGKWFYLDDKKGALLVRKDWDSLPRPLVTIATIAEPDARLDWINPSPGGEYVAFGVSQPDDEESSTIHVVETSSGKILPERLPFTAAAVYSPPSLAWLPDGSGFFYAGGLTRISEDPLRYIFFHRLRSLAQPELQAVPLTTIVPRVQISRDGRWACISELPDGKMEPHPVAIRCLHDDQGWRPFLRDTNHLCIGDFLDESYVAVTTEGADRGRVVRIPIAAWNERDKWQELVPESEAVLNNVTRVNDRLVLTELVNAHSRLRVLTLEGDFVCTIPLPAIGTVTQASFSSYYLPYAGHLKPTESGVSFVFTQPAESPTVYHYDLSRGQLTLLRPSAARMSSVVSRQLFAKSPDGTMVSITLSHDRSLDMSQPQPVLMQVYGGYAVCLTPSWMGELAPFYEAGGVLATVNVRGGGEYGRQWYQEGRGRNKVNTWMDLFAAAEHLISGGVTTADKLALTGGSFGGLAAGVALTARPDLWRVVVARVPALDLLRGVAIDRFALQRTTPDRGNPNDFEDARVLFSYSPYHNIVPGVHYPSTMVVAGENDTRCPAYHARKFVAALQHANASDNPILLRVTAHGHDAASFSTLEWLGFIMKELELVKSEIGR